MKIEIGAYEAKTKLPELLREVQAGKRFTITNRGKAVAELVPCQTQDREELPELIRKFLETKKKYPVRGPVNIKEWIDWGRE